MIVRFPRSRILPQTVTEPLSILPEIQLDKMWRVLMSACLVSLVTCDTLRFKPHASQASSTDKPHASTRGADMMCPDRLAKCVGNSTCCLLSSSKYGCCPLSFATCCEDHIHCCPAGFKCDLTIGYCFQGDKVIAMVTKVSANEEVASVSCDKSGEYKCPDDMTCCKSELGSWACCPLPKAVCCEDGVHCCPNGYRCNKRKDTCEEITNKANTNAMVRLTDAHHQSGATTHKAKPLTRKRMTCPGGKAYCDGGRTCCFKDKWTFNCCPFVNGICCNDSIHCCPLGYTCSVKLGKCTKASGVTLPWGQTEGSRSTTEEEPQPQEQIVSVDDNSVLCPGSEAFCPDGSTCCELTTGQFACCPLKQAVCCDDHLHCCPAGTTCDPEAATCKQGDTSVPWHTKMPAIPRVQKDYQQCADNKTTCPDKTTCCAMLDGYYACCPYENAKCCPDKLHCCPSDETCDPVKGECEAPRGTMMPWADKVLPSKDIVCPDNKTCPSTSTCCQVSVGLFACCPLKQAVCCSDHTHCCPNGYTCNITAQTCSSNNGAIPWSVKSPARPIRDQRVMCHDNASYCPDQTTCCMLSTGQYGCCPLPQAVCCVDGEHCCPGGYTCDVEKGSCQKFTHTIPWSEKIPASPVVGDVGWVVCPDKTSQCADGQTCCKLPTGVYGCCPLPEAVCCADQHHCCPKGTTCDPTVSKCLSTTNSLQQSWSLVLKPQVLLNHEEMSLTEKEDQTCDDGTKCPAGATCCRMQSGAFGCCPFDKGTCCSDQQHCCPGGFHCDETSRRCDKMDTTLSISSALFTRYKSRPPVEEVMIITCPGSNEQCPDGSTCCKQPSGQYGCCNFTNAVCCSDGVHCCPTGFTCDAQSGTCTQSIDGVHVTPLISTLSEFSANYIECPDHVHECPEGNTCCMLDTEEWGCCAMPQAVCCSDGVHCCPHGYACDLASDTCTQSGYHSNTQAFLSIATINIRHSNKP